MNVYFVPGMCANGRIFEKISVPLGYTMTYIEWLTPLIDESLEDYVHRISAKINRSEPYILIGYSLGGIIVQEMNRFLNPEKTIIISSIKHKDEIPSQIKLSHKINFADKIFKKIYFENKKIINTYVRLMLGLTPGEAQRYISHTSFEYMYWSIKQISDWKPQITYPNLYHIHGTKDRTFPHKRIEKAIFVNEGTHMMIIRKSNEINKILENILLDKISIFT